MSKINHQRPLLKIMDNYRRMRRVSSCVEERKASSSLKKETRKRRHMPILSEAGSSVVLEMFSVLNSYLEAEIAFIPTLMPGKKKSTSVLRKALVYEQKRLEAVCVKLLVVLIEQRALLGDDSLRKWLVWFQEDAEKHNQTALFTLLEIGFRPAFKKVEGVLSDV